MCIEYKILLVGSKYVGKTTFVSSLSTCEFSDNYIPSGCNPVVETYRWYSTNKGNPCIKIVQLSDETKIQKCINNTDCVIIMFDNTLYSLFRTKNWYSLIRRYIENKIPIILVRNKTDLRTDLSMSEINHFVETNQLKYYEISVKNNDQERVFIKIMNSL